MTLYYEPQRVSKPSFLYWTPVEHFLELVDCEANTLKSTLKRLSLEESADFIPPASVDPRMIVVDGPIGAGKSTFCRKLAEYVNDRGMKAVVIEEVVALERFNEYGITLEEYYRDPHKNAYQFQLAVTKALTDQLLEYCHTDKYKEYDIVIFDRWLPSTSAFILFQMDEGHITYRQAMYLHYLIDVGMSCAGVAPGTHIRFATDPLVCEHRIIQRAGELKHRQCEEDAILTVRRTNVFLKDHRGIYTPVFNLDYRKKDDQPWRNFGGNQSLLLNAAKATRHIVIDDSIFLGPDRRYYFQIGVHKVNSVCLFNALCDWIPTWKEELEKNWRWFVLDYDQFEEALAAAYKEPVSDSSSRE